MLLITMIMYLIMNLAPGNPIDMLVGEEGLTPDEIEKIRISLGLHEPVYIRYLKWLEQLAHGNLGFSYLDHQPVLNRITERLVPTFSLMFFVVAVSYLIAVPIGVISAIRQYTWADYLATALAFSGISFPNFFSGLVGIYFFSLILKWLPTGGLETLGHGFSVLDRFHHLLLPGLVLAFRLWLRWHRSIDLNQDSSNKAGFRPEYFPCGSDDDSTCMGPYNFYIRQRIHQSSRLSSARS